MSGHGVPNQGVGLIFKHFVCESEFVFTLLHIIHNVGACKTFKRLKRFTGQTFVCESESERGGSRCCTYSFIHNFGAYKPFKRLK